MHKFIITGAHAGKTINLGGYQFVDGVHTMAMQGDNGNVIPSEEDAKGLGDYLGKCYQAYREGSPEHRDFLAKQLTATAAEPAPTPSPTPAPTPAQEPAADELDRKQKGAIRSALVKLDPKVDAHWTDAGLPSVKAVRELSGVDTASRADVEALAPKLTRDEAAKVAAENAGS